jgi:hypothetical protein
MQQLRTKSGQKALESPKMNTYPDTPKLIFYQSFSINIIILQKFHKTGTAHALNNSSTGTPRQWLEWN